MPPTRLCRDCRTMLAPILPRAGLVQADYVVTRPAAPARQAIAVAPSAPDADFDDVAFAPAAGTGEGFALVNNRFSDDLSGDFRPQSVASAPVAATQPVSIPQATPLAPEAFIAPDQYEDGEVFNDTGQYVGREISAPPNPPPAPIIPLDVLDDVASVAETTNGLPAAEPRADSLPPVFEDQAAPVEAHPGAADSLAGIAEPQVAAETFAPADPWDDPLPAYEYSRNEWPMLAKEQPPSLISRLKWPLVAFVVIAAAAAVYFLFIKPHGQTPGASTQEPLTVPVAPLPTAPPASPATATSPAPDSEKKETPPASVTQAIDSQSKHTLQAMASPNEAEANGMVERLKSAGLPAYVVRADLGSRGTWYRVRIGGFATHEEAQRFAAEARSRAAAAGVALKDLQVTAYDKP
jgi:cell division septation protein DedD